MALYEDGAPLNADVAWEKFDACDYLEHNYRELRDDDRDILELIRDFFCSCGLRACTTPSADARAVLAVDVGAGANLYPALTMLPFADRVTLLELAGSNLDWLKAQCAAYDTCWDQFWAVLRARAPYWAVPDPRRLFRTRATVEPADLYGLPVRRYDLGTMFFVAESISGDRGEFERAVKVFVGALRPGSPFAAAFMENSLGYEVGGYPFPAVQVGRDDVRASLAPISDDLRIRSVDSGHSGALREGYDGMILATGRAKI